MQTWCSASQLFVQHGTITFSAIIRKQQFLRLLCSCNNAVSQAFVSCDRFWCSPILEKWRSDLYVWTVSLHFFVFLVCLFVFSFFFFGPRACYIIKLKLKYKPSANSFSILITLNVQCQIPQQLVGFFSREYFARYALEVCIGLQWAYNIEQKQVPYPDNVTAACVNIQWN